MNKINFLCIKIIMINFAGGFFLSNDERPAVGKKHNLIMEDRNVLNVTGVIDVSGFDDEKILLITEKGELTVGGYSLHINKFSQESGELNLDGEICSLVYSETKQNDGGFFSKLFR